MKIAIVTDSTSYLSKEEQTKYNIKVVPIPVIIDDDTYQEGVNISNQEFYQKANASKELPSTSQPPMGEMIQMYEDLAKEGYDAVISIHLASTISGMYKQLKTIAPTIEGIKVVPYDSKITVKLMGYLAIAAAKMAQQGKSLNDILNRLDRIRDTINEVFVVDDLKNLVKGGRLSNASAFVGSLLRIKPLLTFDDQSDKIVAFDKIRSRKKALKRAEDIFEKALKEIDYPIRLIVINADDEEGGDDWFERLHEKFPDVKIEQSYFGPVIGTHLGSKALAIAWMRDVNNE